MGTIEPIIAVVVVISFIASTGFNTAVFAVSNNDDDEANIMRSFINDNNPNNAAAVPSRVPNLMRTMEVLWRMERPLQMVRVAQQPFVLQAGWLLVVVFRVPVRQECSSTRVNQPGVFHQMHGL